MWSVFICIGMTPTERMWWRAGSDGAAAVSSAASSARRGETQDQVCSHTQTLAHSHTHRHAPCTAMGLRQVATALECAAHIRARMHLWIAHACAFAHVNTGIGIGICCMSSSACASCLSRTSHQSILHKAGIPAHVQVHEGARARHLFSLSPTPARKLTRVRTGVYRPRWTPNLKK